MTLHEMDLEQAVIYRPKGEIAGERPYFVLPNDEMKDYFDMTGGAPESSLIEWAAQFLPEHTDFVDIGTHIGTWGIILGLSQKARVFGFEAQPWLSYLCNAGFALNGLTQAVCVNVAMSDCGGETTMRVPLVTNQSTLTASGFDSEGAPVHLETGGASIVKGVKTLAAGFEEFTVKTQTLDYFYTHPSLIKIDVEGAELAVLRGARHTIAYYHPTILFECWVDERGQNIENLFKCLHDDLSYKTTQVGNWPEMWLAEPNA